MKYYSCQCKKSKDQTVTTPAVVTTDSTDKFSDLLYYIPPIRNDGGPGTWNTYDRYCQVMLNPPTSSTPTKPAEKFSAWKCCSVDPLRPNGKLCITYTNPNTAKAHCVNPIQV